MKGFFPHSSSFFNRDMAINQGGYRESFVKSQDHDLWIRLARIGEIACLKERLVTINEHDMRISNSTSDYSQLVYATTAIIFHHYREANPDGIDPTYTSKNIRSILKYVDTYIKNSNYKKMIDFKSRIRLILSTGFNLKNLIKICTFLIYNINLIYGCILTYLFGTNIAYKIFIRGFKR